MKRRTFITTTAITAASIVGSGCMGVTGDSQPPSNREVTDVSVTIPESAEFTIEPTVTRASITSDQTAQVKLVVTWTGDEVTQFTFGNAVPFSYPQNSTDSSGLLLLPADASIERQNKRTWLPKTGEGGLAAPMVSREPELAPGETASGTWEVWADPEEADFIKPGTYQFESSLKLGVNDEPVDWTLSVTIET